MVIQPKDYIQTKKTYFLKHTLLWGFSIGILFSIGLVLNGERANPFTVIAAVMVLGFAQNLTRYISFARYKDPSLEEAEIVEKLEGSYAIFHSAIIPCEEIVIYFKHIIVTPRKIYCIPAEHEQFQKYRRAFIEKMEKKGINNMDIHILHINTLNALQKACSKMQKEINSMSGETQEIENILKAIMM